MTVTEKNKQLHMPFLVDKRSASREHSLLRFSPYMAIKLCLHSPDIEHEEDKG